MAIGVEEYADVVLRLHLGEDGALRPATVGRVAGEACLVRGHRQPEQPRVEVGELVRLWGADGDRRDPQLGPAQTLFGWLHGADTRIDHRAGRLEECLSLC